MHQVSGCCRAVLGDTSLRHHVGVKYSASRLANRNGAFTFEGVLSSPEGGPLTTRDITLRFSSSEWEDKLVR